jgi:hypothetical protein
LPAAALVLAVPVCGAYLSDCAIYERWRLIADVQETRMNIDVVFRDCTGVETASLSSLWRSFFARLSSTVLFKNLHHPYLCLRIRLEGERATVRNAEFDKFFFCHA